MPVEGNLKVQMRNLADLKPYERNARIHPPEQIEALRESIRRLGIYRPILLREDGTIGAGHGLHAAALAEGVKKGPTITLNGLSDPEWKQLVLADNRLAEGSSWDAGLIKLELADLAALEIDMTALGFGSAASIFEGIEGLDGIGMGLGSSGNAGTADPKHAGKLAEMFGVVPFSVLNAREGWWQDRKRAWLALGIESEKGRGDNLLKMSDTMLEPDPEKRKKMGNGKRPAAAFGQDIMRGEHLVGQGEPETPADGKSGTSIFDPVLCEVAYRWFSPKGGTILDPFSGGSVRGIVAGKLGRNYIGVDLRPEQVEANRDQGASILGDDDGEVVWHCGDSTSVLAAGPDAAQTGEVDMVFSCPPYADLEVYSDDPRDLSTMAYADFRDAYAEIIRLACDRLKPNAFACFVIGEVRDRKGNYLGFVPDTIRAFEAAGMRFYNEMILQTAAGSLALRTGKQFAASRKVGKTHQNVLVFLKGDAKKAVASLGAVEFGDVETAAADDQSEAKSDSDRWGEEL